MSGLVLMAYVLGIGFCIVAFGITRHRHPKTPAPTRPAAHEPRVGAGTTVPYHCATYGHYYQRRYSDRWRCAKCGVLSEVVPTDDVADIEAHANGETA